jgi:hypothetical protein
MKQQRVTNKPNENFEKHPRGAVLCNSRDYEMEK